MVIIIDLDATKTILTNEQFKFVLGRLSRTDFGLLTNPIHRMGFSDGFRNSTNTLPRTHTLCP